MIPPDVEKWLDEIDDVERSAGWPEAFVQYNREKNLEAWHASTAGRVWALRCAVADLRRAIIEAVRDLAAAILLAIGLACWGFYWLSR